MGSADVLTVSDIGEAKLAALLTRYGLCLRRVAAGARIPCSYWGDREAGVIGLDVLVRPDTPVHSALHETCHVICMDQPRRDSLVRDAGGDDLEEAAVCYLQILLADELSGVGRLRLMRDMDAWGYSFRLGSTRAWFERDADDARDWLVREGLVRIAANATQPTFALRSV
ncbi:MAG: hypothetical protein AAGE85_06225 [Pseudomonadota bacterium]